MLDRDTVTDIERIYKNQTSYRYDFYICLKRAKSLPLEEYMTQVIDKAIGTLNNSSLR